MLRLWSQIQFSFTVDETIGLEQVAGYCDYDNENLGSVKFRKTGGPPLVGYPRLTGDWRKLHNEKLHNLYSSLNVIRMIKSRRMRWAGHVARML
jgi:hypothetical protein